MFEWRSWLGLALASLMALAAAVAITALVAVIVRSIARRKNWARMLVVRVRRSFRVTLLVVALGIAVMWTLPYTEWLPVVRQIFTIAAIGSISWFACALSIFLIDVGINRYRVDVRDNRVARRLHTQLAIVRRLVVALIVIVAAGAILLTFPGAQAVGASVLASAGLFSIVAGLAAQSTLANVFAGVQLAFSDAIRVDDVVVVEKEWGRIEEITLTYVVVHLWDDRRLVLPSTHFTVTPFENWTRRSSELLGSIELDVDWSVRPALMRAHLATVLARTELWDGRTHVLQVTDAVGGFVRVRILVTAVDAPTLFDLRCFVREEMVTWLHSTAPEPVPRTRVQLVTERLGPQPDLAAEEVSAEQGGLFTGTDEAEKRARTFTTSIPVVPPQQSTDL